MTERYLGNINYHISYDEDTKEFIVLSDSNLSEPMVQMIELLSDKEKAAVSRLLDNSSQGVAMLMRYIRDPDTIS